MYITTTLFGALALLAAQATASTVLDLTPANFDTEIGKGTPALVEFFAPWCGHCKNLAPIYDELAKSFASAIPSKVKIAKVDADQHKDLGKRFGITGFPTLKWFDGSGGDPEDYSGGRELQDLQEFVEKKTSTRPKRAPKPESFVQSLTDSTFHDFIGKDKDVFVAFTAPWCGHCKKLHPEWEKLATDLSFDQDKVVIANVDADKNHKIGGDQKINSYPTIKYFKAGQSESEALPYSGGRDEESLLTFVNVHAKTHRLPGGGLDLKAGTVKVLDDIVGRWNKAGEDLSALTEETRKAAAGLTESAKSKYTDYYLRVLDKLEANKGYLEKESTRLEGLLKKGGLAREKEDDLTSRLNVLKSFIGEKIGKDEL